MTELAIAQLPDKATLANGHAVHKPNHHPRKSQALAQLFIIQRCLMEDIEDEETTPAARAQLARAWSELEDRKRILRGRGLPKPIEPRPPKAKHPRSSFTEGPEPGRSVPLPPQSEPAKPQE